MEVAIAGNGSGGSPFQREVREWQRIDPNTGALLTGRLEADRWINGSLNSYGKVVDSQNVSQPNGTQHSQRKQLEVLQARTSAGSMQVIRAHTVQTTSSRWTATSSSSASSSNSSSPLMTSLNAGAGANHGRSHLGGYFANHSQRFHGNLSLTNESGDSGGPAADDDHLMDNFLLSHHPKGPQHHVFSATPSLKLSNLMKSTPTVTNGTSASGSQNKAGLHNSNNVAPSTTTAASHRPQPRQRQQTSSSSAVSTITTGAATATSSHGPRRTTTTSSGLFRYDSNRYDLPTTEAHVGGTSGGKIIDICSRDIDDVGDDDNDNDRDNDDDRVNSSASRRRQEATWHSPAAPLQRGRSISTDDLTSNGNTSTHANGGVGGGGDDNDDDEPAEWRRVSKIRRSFQFPSTTAPESTRPATSPVFRPRPVDLPERSVSVSKIRAELENGRRLSTAMRNNHVDLVALDSILNGGSGPDSGAASPLTTKKKAASFLTAESLKEIRGKLKKLSDESLYKDDFVTKKDERRDETPEVTAPSPVTDFQYSPRPNGSLHTTNSLESRNAKYKDTSSAEWHLRRKSYGFEKMSPPSDKSMFRFENSTDSGLGRSSDLGNWSPTTDASARSTVVTFGEKAAPENRPRPMVQRRLRNRTQPQSEAESAEMKRHSIAVDESHYVRENLRKTSAVHLNGFYSKDSSPQNSGLSDDNSRRQKRVEFCKTEVHFAAESGRVNIVETDGKPPPSNNFRRRRRSSSGSSTTSSASLDAPKAGLPVIHFGDEHKAIFDENPDAEEDLGEDKSPMSNVTVSIPISVEKNFDSESRDGDDHPDEISIRGILKNKPIKPKPYHLGENIDSADALWGVQLKPVGPRGFSGERDQTEEDFKEATVSSKSVAERIRIVEERKEGAGYSTKINLNLSNSPYEWTDSGAPRSSYDDQLKHDFYGLSSFAKLSPPLTDDGLKSTPLIIKTLRSANQFDEAMRRLSISSNTSSGGAETQTASVTTKHVSSLSHIAKAVNTSVSSSSYSSSLNGDFKTSRSSRPIAAPRLKVVGSTTNSISHQLSQLRRMYDHAGLDSDDSARADEEVKGYFGGDLDDDDDDDVCGYEASELSGSWSRVKAKRTVLKTQTTKKLSQEVPQSNIMNIELHSPMTTAIKKPESIRMQPPVAKPRTLTAVKQAVVPKTSEERQKQSKSLSVTTSAEASEHLKIVRETRGARKLREHELSYFGVKVTSGDVTDARSATTASKPKLITASKRSLPSRKLPSAAKNEERSANQWSLPSDKPDLLRHSPILVEPQVVTKTAVVAPSVGVQRRRSRSPADSSDDQTDGIYENIKAPGTYCRQNDLERDEMILSEMTRTADQTLKAVSDEAAQKDLRRRSITRRSSKPLETIDEKFAKPISKTSSRPRTTAHRIVRECSSRPSSASSCDSLPPTPTPTKQRSRSRSRENEYVNLQPKPKTSSRGLKYRSSSRESQKSGNSSTEDIAHKIEMIRKPKRTTTKDEPQLVRYHHSQQQRSLRSSTESHDRHKVTPRSSTRDRVESHDPPQSRSHRSSHAATKSDAEHKRSSHTSTVESKSSTKTTRSRTQENDKPSKSSMDRVSKTKAHSSQSQSERLHSRPHRSTGSKSATMSSSGNNSDTLIHGKNSTKHRSSSASSSKQTSAKSSSKDRK